MKYPLAVANRLLGILGEDIAVGYDIACTFSKTLARSTIGPLAKTQRMRGVVPAFHGYAHNRGCQVNWHPMYVEGTGKADFEQCERLFSGSNALAAITRFATVFHREQELVEYFSFVSDDKYAESGE